MDMRQLTTFRTLASTLSFTQTAAALNYVQSTVTAQIQALEAELGVQLFDRLGKRIALTDAGQRLLTYADRILALAEEAHQMVAHSDSPSGTLTVSAPESLCIYRLPAILQAFRQRCPQVRLLYRPVPCFEAHRYVSDGEVDVAFVVESPLRFTSLVVETLLPEPVLVIAPADHPLARLPRVTAADLIGEATVLTEKGCSYRNAFEHTLMSTGVRPTTTLEFGNVEAIKQCVIAGIGISVLPAFVVAQEVAQGRLAALNWADNDLTMLTQMMWHKDKWISPALQIFLEVSREMLQGMADANGVVANTLVPSGATAEDSPAC